MDLNLAITEAAKKIGYTVLKDKQKEAVSLFLQGHDTFVSLPTGYGKSLIYALLPLAHDYSRG